ncbi:hypothetical protein [Methylobacterium sp. JK268]
MPVAIGIAILGAVGVSEGVAVGVGIAGVSLATIVGSTAIIGAGAALNVLGQALQSQKRNPENITVKQPIGPRRRGHGQCKLGGYIFFFDVVNGVMVRGTLHCDGPIAEVLEVWFDDVMTGVGPTTTADALVIPDARFRGTALIERHLGTVPQAASGFLLTSGSPDPWTAAMRLDGIAYTVGKFGAVKHGDLIYPGGAPTIRIVARMVPVYDPRDATQDPNNPATWKQTGNAALNLLDYITHPTGLGIPIADVLLSTFADLADVSDEPVALRQGGVEPRYRCWGTYDYDEERADVLARYTAACDARLYEDADGKVAVRGGRWIPPTVTITPDMILGWDAIEVGDKALATVNRIKWTYTSPLNDYQQIEGQPWDDEDAQALSGVLPTDKVFRNCPSHAQGRRLAKIALHRLAPRFKITGLRLNSRGLRVFGEDVVNLKIPVFGIDTTVAVENGRLAGSFADQLTVDVYEFTAAAYAWSPAIEEGTTPLALGAYAPAPIPTPSNPAYTVQRVEAGGVVTGLYALWSADPVAGRTDLTLVGEYRVVGDAEWRALGYQGSQPITDALNEATAYEARFAWTDQTSISAFSAAVPFTVAADTTPPGPPTAATATGASGRIDFGFTAPNSANVGAVVVYVGTTTTFAAASAVASYAIGANQAITGSYSGPTPPLSPGDDQVWFRALNRSGLGDASSTVGPLPVTVT